jgi:hypothetical protein
MRTKSWTCAPVELNVPVNHDRLHCQLQNSQSREKAWELAFPEFTGLVSVNGMLSSDVLPFRLPGGPIGEGYASGVAAIARVIHVYRRYHDVKRSGNDEKLESATGLNACDSAGSGATQHEPAQSQDPEHAEPR